MNRSHTSSFSIVVVGGGAAGLAAAASILKRRPKMDVAIVEPRADHFYQPGWTLVGAGVFSPKQTRRPMAELIPRGATWIRSSVARFRPDANSIDLDDASTITYRVLVVAAGLSLDWDKIAGLKEALGRDGVTSNYNFETAPYTRDLTKGIKEGVALFTQPPMPIKCAGAPQKAMYLACDDWRRRGVLKNIDVSFHSAGDVLFGVSTYVPPLMNYVDAYKIGLNFKSNLIAVDGPSQEATFKTEQGEIALHFDMLHVCPPQKAPQFISESPLAGATGYIDVNQYSLRHKKHENVFALGDVAGTPNAKTAAAVRKQAPVVAVNVLATMDGKSLEAGYDGYGSCPLTVERGKIVLAEFGYGGVLLPSFPRWLIDGQKPSRLSWLLKEKILPPIYWNAMLKGREWLAAPQSLAGAERHGN